MSATAALYRQFGNPRGPLGRIAGWIMAARPSNRKRNDWTVDLLNLQPFDRVLEIGCGPGLALRGAAARVAHGLVIGLDHSDTMLRQAARRNAAAIRTGHLRLERGGLDLLPALSGPFDKVFSVNVFQFLPDHRRTLATVASVMKDGALLATTYMPRHRNARPEDADRFAEALKTEMAVAGFRAVHTERAELLPMPAVCVLGLR